MWLVVRSKAVFDGRLLNVKPRFEHTMAASSQFVDNIICLKYSILNFSVMTEILLGIFLITKKKQ